DPAYYRAAACLLGRRRPPAAELVGRRRQLPGRLERPRGGLAQLGRGVGLLAVDGPGEVERAFLGGAQRVHRGLHVLAVGGRRAGHGLAERERLALVGEQGGEELVGDAGIARAARLERRGELL